VLYRFSGNDGANPTGDLIMDPNGALYGTTAGGGNSSCGCGNVGGHSACGCGTVFKLVP
jgi:hypothetical protein